MIVKGSLCDLCNILGASEEYRLPFSQYLETDEEPAFNEMREVIIVQQRQLTLPEKYDQDEVSYHI